MYKLDRIDNTLSTRLDIIRFLAASTVFLGHMRGGFFDTYHNLNELSQNAFNLVAFFISQLEGEAVVVFFVLSGFLVGGAHLSNKSLNNFSFKKYFANRLSRMWSVLIPALFLTTLTCLLSYIISGEIKFYNALSLKDFAFNVMFLQTILSPSYGLNDPLWSLAYEFWYYILWGVYLLALKKKNLSNFVIALGLTFIGIFFVPKILALFPLWLMGFSIRLIPPLRKGKNIAFVLCLLLFVVSLVGSSLYRIDSNLLPTNYLVGVAFTFFLWSMCHTTMHFSNRISLKNSTWQMLASFSFSLYAIHFSLERLLLELLKLFNVQIRLQVANVENWTLFLVLSIIIYLLSYIFYFFTEKHTTVIRASMYRMFNITK